MKFDDCREFHACEICGNQASPHEIVTRGAHGPREPWNVIYLCDDHHTLGPDAFHRIGRSTFAARFPKFEDKIRSACKRMHKPFYERG